MSPRRNESPESTIIQHLVARCFGFYRTARPTGREPCQWSAGFTKPKMYDFRTKSYCLIEYLCTPYPAEPEIFMGLRNTLQLNTSTKCKKKYTRRHRESTRKQVQGTRAERARASTTRDRRHRLSSKTNRLTTLQARARSANANAKHAATKGHVVQAPRQWYWSCCRCCPLS